MTTPFLPRGALPGSLHLGTVEDFARQIGEVDLFNVLPTVPKNIRESLAFTQTLACEVWMKVYRKNTVRAGAASTRGRLVELNSLLFTVGSREDVRNTFLHEVAHILADLYYKTNCNHDWRWVRMARLLGDTGDRCHDYDYLAARQRPKNITYVCQDCEQEYHRSRQLDTVRMRCGRCRHGRLKLKVRVSEDLRKALGL